MGNAADARVWTHAYRRDVPRYLIERTFVDAWAVSAGAEGTPYCRAIIDGNTDEGVTWINSYIRDDGKKAFCIYEAPSPEALRRAAARSGLTINRISEVRTLDPYAYTSSAASRDD